MAEQWTNWSGSLRFTPAELLKPASEEELAAIVRRAGESGRVLRVVGAGHSSSPLVETPEVLVSLERLRGLIAVDREACQAWVRPGTTIEELGRELLEHGLAAHNTGDVDVQTIAGAVSTGTHGTGARLRNLSSMLIGMRLATGAGDLAEFSQEDQPAVLRAARVALGSLGVFAALRLQLVPSFRLHRREWCLPVAAALPQLDELIARYRNLDLYWYPRSDEAKIRMMDAPGAVDEPLPHATCVYDRQGWSAEILPRTRTLKFDEMEYAVPAAAAPACFQAIRQRIKERHRKHVGWRVLYRTVAADDAYLSPAAGRATVTISLHHNAGLPFWAYFTDIEPIFRAYGGRPHWAKKHTLRAADLRPLYPDWEAFHAIRRRLDPAGVLLNQHLRDLFADAD